MKPGRAAPQAVEPRDDARIAKIMARAGLCSRRDAETWIAAGRVAVNGAVIASPALNVGPADRITIDGMPLPQREPTRLFLFHKPRGVVTTARDPEARQTIFDVLPEGLPRLVTVGRLDINTEGLMLLTNDGGLARLLELPATGWLRRYRVRANGEVAPAALDALAQGVTIDGVDYAGIDAKLDRVQGANAWLTLGLREGKNREIKRVLEHLGLAVTRLIRISFGPFQLGEQPVGTVIEVRSRVLRDQLGETLARQAGIELEEWPQAASRRNAHDVARPEPLRTERPVPGARAHVSALRAARKEDATEGRRRTERSATADRKGRAVKVERVSSTAPRTAEPDTRNARRFSRENRDQAGGASRPGRPARSDAYDTPRRSREDRRDGPNSPAGGGRGEAPRRPGRSDAYDMPRRGREDRRGGSNVPAGGGRGEAPRRPGRSDAYDTPRRGREDRRDGSNVPVGGERGEAPRRQGAARQSDASRAGTERKFGGASKVKVGPARSFGYKDRPSGGLPGRPQGGDRPRSGPAKGGSPRGSGKPHGGGGPRGSGKPQGGGRRG
ncbi:MAG TPA: pseudouridine synthase [Lichenihabitans sp.]|jgi:23S rRNA pseudouridine2605 synthase|nr:pseudouridine synthase [Lichenihabitans sp.]